MRLHKKEMRNDLSRKLNDSVKPGVGIDGAKGEDFARKSTASPWADNPPRKAGGRSISARTKNDDNGASRGAVGIDGREGEDILRRVEVDFETSSAPVKWAGNGTGGNRDVWNDVEGQSSDSGNRAVKSRGND